MIKVVDAKYLGAFKASLLFCKKNYTTGESELIQKEIDLEDYLCSKSDFGVFAPLKNVEFFKNFHINSNTLEWENGADIAPERLFEM